MARDIYSIMKNGRLIAIYRDGEGLDFGIEEAVENIPEFIQFLWVINRCWELQQQNFS